jgi:hypothetical protein
MRRTLVLSAALFASCAATPELSFEDDAGAVATVDAMAFPDAASGVVDTGAAETSAALDASPLTCSPTNLPPEATACCNGLPCVDRQGQGCNCGDCFNKCGSNGGWCCVDSQGHISCKPSANACH